MPSFDMTKSNLMSVDMATDAEAYSASATSIDYEINKVGDWSGTVYYNMALEHWNASSGYWEALELQTGYFNVTTPWKSFYLA